MKKLTLGILAHVDAGKTTLSEAMLFESGRLRRLGRVDHGDAFLDTDIQERERGITIFSKQAILPLPEMEVTLLDTPGHVDFSSEMERTLQVLDYAVLVISGADGVQSHTRTLWKLLKRYHVPVFLFINKMDLVPEEENLAKDRLIKELQTQLSEGCVDFSMPEEERMESIAMCDETTLDTYLSTGTVEKETIKNLIYNRRLFPCFFGSALKLEGVNEWLNALQEYALQVEYPSEFGAKVYKIAHDPQGARLTYLKVTGGVLHVKDVLSGPGWEEKVDQIRLYSGTKYETITAIEAGRVCAVTGLTKTYPGQGLGNEKNSVSPMLDSFLTYQVILPPGIDAPQALPLLRLLEEEDPQLHVVWNEQLKEIHVQLMGEVQLEVLKRLIEDRFKLDVAFGPGNIVYRETVAAPVEGMGHYEPLRHYAEVHLLLQPGEVGSGLTLRSAVSEDELEKNWQNLVLTHLSERSFPGVLTGSPITDMVITLIAGRAHIKHTEGGDFREATYRAVRHGLLHAQNVLLEPWYEFELMIPASAVGRAMTDLERLFAEFTAPEIHGNEAVISGKGPVATLQSYTTEVIAYTRGEGKLICLPYGYAPCHNTEEVVAAIQYEAEHDMENPGDSVFCAHGAGFVVKWNEAANYMHLGRVWHEVRKVSAPKEEKVKAPHKKERSATAEDDELMAIFERTYGPVRRRDIRPNAVRHLEEEGVTIKDAEPEYLLVDGYNIIHAWNGLKELAGDNMDLARQRLQDLLCDYQSVKGSRVIVVYDAYRVVRAKADVEKYHNIDVVYTKQAETADTFIERATYVLGKGSRVRVATSDRAEQIIVVGHGAFRLSASEFEEEVRGTSKQLAETIEAWNKKEAKKLTQSALPKDVKLDI